MPPRAEPGADALTPHIYAALAGKERAMTVDRTRAVPALARLTMTAAEIGFSPSTSRAKWARPCAPLRKSTGRVADRIPAPAGTPRDRASQPGSA